MGNGETVGSNIGIERAVDNYARDKGCFINSRRVDEDLDFMRYIFENNEQYEIPLPGTNWNSQFSKNENPDEFYQLVHFHTHTVSNPFLSFGDIKHLNQMRERGGRINFDYVNPISIVATTSRQNPLLFFAQQKKNFPFETDSEIEEAGIEIEEYAGSYHGNGQLFRQIFGKPRLKCHNMMLCSFNMETSEINHSDPVFLKEEQNLKLFEYKC